MIDECRSRGKEENKMGYETRIYCDKCGKGYVSIGNISKTVATMLMRNLGWSVGKQWLCPNCKNGVVSLKCSR